jgi:hypothetical protein
MNDPQGPHGDQRVLDADEQTISKAFDDGLKSFRILEDSPLATNSEEFKV